MNCNIKTSAQHNALKTMQAKYPNVPKAALEAIAIYGGTSVENTPGHPEIPSRLFQDCLSITGDETQAVTLAAQAYLPSFIHKYGDWKNSSQTANIVMNDGTPQLFYGTNQAYSSYYHALANVIAEKANALQDDVQLHETYDEIEKFISNLEQAHNGTFKGYMFRDIISSAVFLQQEGLLNNTKVSVGFQEASTKNFISQGEVAVDFGYLLNGIGQIGFVEYSQRTRGYNNYVANVIFENGHLSVKPDLTMQDILRSKSSLAQQIKDNMNWVNPNLQARFLANQNDFRLFMQGLANALLCQPQKYIMYSHVVQAEKFVNYFHNKAIQRLYVHDVNGESQLALDFAAPMPHYSTQYAGEMQKLLDATENPASIDSLLETITRMDPYFGGLATLLIGKSTASVKYKDQQWMITDASGESRYTAGQYNRVEHSITLAKDGYQYPAALIMHEVIHSITIQHIHQGSYAKRAEALLKEAQKLIFSKYKVSSIDELKEINNQLAYGLYNVDEFFSMLWTNSNFAKELNSVGPRSKKSLLGKIKDFVLNILGIKETSELYVQASDLLEEMLNAPLYTKEELDEWRSIIPEEFYDISYATPEPVYNLTSFQINWNQQQSTAISDIVEIIKQDINSGHPRICRIIGKAGTGKTSVCPEIITRLVQQGIPIDKYTCVAAVANQAKSNLALKFPKGLHIQAKSVAALLGKRIAYDKDGNEIWVTDKKSADSALKNAQKLRLLIVDESSMLSNKQMQEIESFCSNATIVYVGDKRQVRPIEETYNPNTPFINKQVDYSIELEERVRQGEGAPILDIADVYGDVSGNVPTTEVDAAAKIMQMVQQMNSPVSVITDTNAVLSVNNSSFEKTVESLMPIIKEAIATENTNKIGIIPFFDKGATGGRTKFNNLIRFKLLQDWGIDASLDENNDNYVEKIPYQKGEMLVLNKPYDIGDGLFIDNGQKVIVEETGYTEDLPQYHITWNGYPVTIKVECTNIKWYDDSGQHYYTLRSIAKGSQRFYKDHLEELKNKAFNSGLQGLAYMTAVGEFKNWKNLGADVSPCWALNVHKAQGQTYEVAYVPVDDYSTALSLSQRRHESSINQATQLASELYTAITRASNITILGKNNFQDVNIDYVALNNEIIKNKVTGKQIIKEALEDIKDAEQPTKTEIVIPAKYRKLYDFLQFVTGTDAAFKNLKTKEGQNYANKLTSAFFQRETELLKFNRTFGKVQTVNGSYDYKSLFKGDPNILFTPITKERLVSLEQQYGPFNKVEDVKISRAQAVVPNQYADTFKTKGKNLAEITPETFKHVNNYYWSEVDNTDYLVRLHNGSFNIAFTSKNVKNYGNEIKIQKDSLGYRLDNDGKRMYWLPKNAMIFGKVSTDGTLHETVVIPETAGDPNNISNNIFKSISDDLVSVQPFLTNIKDADLARKMILTAELNSVFSITEPKQVSPLAIIRSKKANYSIDEIKQKLQAYYDNENIAKTYARKLSNSLYQSFRKACSITASRIPTQALASFMSMDVVGYQPEAANEVFVSRWQLWLQGSDLDIDKSYMMGHSFGASGLFHHWSPIADYSNEKRRRISDQLPVPNGKKLVLNDGEDIETSDTIVPVTFNGSNALLDQMMEIYTTSQDGDEHFNAMKEMLNDFNLTGKFDLNPKWQGNQQLSNLIFKLNKHNLHKVTDEEAKNVAIDSIIEVCDDTRNIQSAHSPIDAATKQLKSFLKDLETGTIGDENDNISIFQLQEDNQTGKKVVGVMANALKAFLTITQYYNNYYYDKKDISPEDRPYFLNSLTINGHKYYMSTVANTTLETAQLKALKNALLQYVKVSDDILNTKDDVSIILSAMVTLATDNAKELALAKLHASLNLASIHTYLLTMGVPFDAVVNYTAKSKIFTDLYELTKANLWENQTGKLNSSVWKALAEKAKSFTKQDIESGNGYTIEDINQLQHIHIWTTEFRKLTKLLGINQGAKNGIAQVISFKLAFENIVREQFASIPVSLQELFKTAENQSMPENTSMIDAIIKMHGLSPNKELRAFYMNQIQNFVKKYGVVDETALIDMNKYYSDANYRNMITDLYNIGKATINIFDVINHMPSFYAMLESLNTITERISKGAKGNFLFKKLPELFNPMMIIQSKNIPYVINDTVVKDAQSFCDDYFISDFLINTVNKDYSFEYSVNPGGNVWFNKNVTFDTQEGLEHFQESFNTLVARLKRLQKSEFTKSLVSYKRKDGKTLYKLNFNLDMLNKDSAGEQQLKYQQIVGGFSDIMNVKISTIFSKYKGNSNMTVGDMFYLYNLIFNLGQRGQNSFTSLLDRYVTESGNNSLVFKYLNTVLQFDLLNTPLVVNNKKLHYHLFKRYTFGDNQIQIGDTTFDTSKQILTNLGSVQQHTILQNTYQKFIAAYQSGKLQIEMDLNCN